MTMSKKGITSLKRKHTYFAIIQFVWLFYYNTLLPFVKT